MAKCWSTQALGCATALALAAASALATGDEAPMKVATEIGDGGQQVAHVTNASAKKVQAYVLAVDAVDDSGKVVFRVSEISMRGLQPPPYDAFAPGETSHDEIRLPQRKNGGAPLKAGKVALDFVLYADGSSWGPDTKKDSVRVRATIAGWRTAIAYLRSVLKEKGANAVAEYLESPAGQ